MIEKICFAKTSDWWCGNYRADGTSEHQDNITSDPKTWKGHEYVRLRFAVIPYPPAPFVRVAVWGNDDFAMVRDFKPSEHQQAEQLYEELQLVCITQKLLEEKGFEIF